MIAHLLLLFAACDSSIQAPGDEMHAGSAAVSSVEITPSEARVPSGGSLVLEAEMKDETGEPVQSEVEWTSLAPSVATVDDNGRITGNATGTTFVVASSEGVSDTASLEVAPELVADPEHPNEPVGYERFAEWDASERPGTFKEPCSSVSLLAGCGIGGTGTNLSYPDDASAPVSPPGVWQVTFPEGAESGDGIGMINQLWENGRESFGNEFNEIYYATWVKIHGPDGSADFEVPVPGMKLFGYFGSGDDTADGAWQNYWVIKNDSDTQTQIQSGFMVTFKQQNVVSSTRNQNVETGKVLEAGKWQRMEFVARINDIGSSNGEFHMWIDGTKVMAYTDVRYRTAENPQAFNGTRWNPVWGGTGGTAKTRDDYLLVDHVYISGIPTQ